MKTLKKLIFLIFCTTCFFMCTNSAVNNSGKQNSSQPSDINPEFDINKITVFAFGQSILTEEDSQIYELNPDINIRAIQKWSIWGDEASDYNFNPIKRYHNNNICYIGGGTASVIFKVDFKTNDIFLDMATKDANNQPVLHDEVQSGAYRASLANPKYRKSIIDYCKIQIDAGVDGIFLDEVIGGYSGGKTNNYNGNEGFEDYGIADFNKYLIEKYQAYTAQDWKNNYGMTDNNIIKNNISPDDLVNNFNYRKYLKDHGWNGTTTATSPLNPANPLAKEWGSAVNNRMYKSNTFLGEYTERYWKAIVDELRAYAKDKYDKEIFITSNGIFPYVDFNSLGMYDWNPDEQTPDGRGADYVPVTGGHLNGSKSLMSIYKKMYNKSLEISGKVPLVTFIDWPTEMLNNYNSLPLQEKKDYWQIFGAETYASGLYPAFHLKDTVGGMTAKAAGIMDFYKNYIKFYRDNSIFFHNNTYAANSVNIDKTNLSYNLMQNENSKLALHLVNHNYSSGIISQNNLSIKIDMDYSPSKVFMISPDFAGKRNLTYTYNPGELTVKVDSIKYYDVIIIE